MSYQRERQCSDQSTDCNRWRLSAIEKVMRIRISQIQEGEMLRLFEREFL